MLTCVALLIVALPSPVTGAQCKPPAPLWLSVYDWRNSGIQVVPMHERPSPGALVDTARQYLGVPYSWGGTGESGFDCSGFVNKVYAAHGYDLPRVSREQVRVGLEVPRFALATGDLLFFAAVPGGAAITHVALYIDNNEFIHAATGKGEVTYDRLTEHYYDTRLVTARRVLALPPGRYSTLNGGAVAGVQFKSAEAAVAYAPHMPYAAPPAPPSAPMLTEHRAEDKPVQLATAFVPGANTEVGPALLTRDATALLVHLGAGGLNDHGFALVMPQFTYLGAASALRIDAALPIQVGLRADGRAMDDFKQSWETVRDWGRLLRHVSLGQKEANFYLAAGRTQSASLGHGQIMRYFTPNMASRGVPDFVLHANALTLSVDASWDVAGFEAVIDDVLQPAVLGALGFVRPGILLGLDDAMLRSISLGVTYGLDFRAPYAPGETRAVHAVGLDAEIMLLRGAAHDIRAYADLSGLIHPAGSGWGGAAGALWRANFSGGHVLRTRLEARYSGGSFIPSYFDVFYSLSRQQVVADSPSPTPRTKLALLDALTQAPGRGSLYGELTYRLQRRVALGVSYEDGGPFGRAESPLYAPRSLMVFAQLRRLYLRGTSQTLSLYVAYHLRNFRDWGPFLGLNRTNESLFASGRVDLGQHADIGLSLRKALNPARTQQVSFDATLDLALSYEL